MLNETVQDRTCPDWHDHEWKEEHYGTRCAKCGLFFAHGQAPWDDAAMGLSPNARSETPPTET